MGADRTAMLGIGALSRASGVPVETLRTWERRYGFPSPERKPSGHRLYAVSCVPRLRRISEALARGVRAAQAVGATDEGLTSLLRAYGQGGASPAPAAVSADLPDLLAAVRRYDALGLGRALLGAWGRLGPLEFVRGCVAPLVIAVGAGWASGELEIRHEHFFSERLGDLLRVLRLPFEERASGPLVLLTTLPGESHVLGLHMAALLMAAAGCRVLLLGAQTPSDQLVALAEDTAARAVGLSVSSATASAATTRRIGRLRRALPARTGLLVGGEGAPARERNVVRMTDPGQVDEWARRMAREAAA